MTATTLVAALLHFAQIHNGGVDANRKIVFSGMVQSKCPANWLAGLGKWRDDANHSDYIKLTVYSAK
jgi:hypothetical protein